MILRIFGTKQPAHNTQYKTVGVQLFAGLWFSRQRFPRWIQTQPENPTVSYCQTLAVIVKRQNQQQNDKGIFAA